jgi:hypothetical protein
VPLEGEGPAKKGKKKVTLLEKPFKGIIDDIKRKVRGAVQASMYASGWVCIREGGSCIGPGLMLGRKGLGGALMLRS